jgi:hypothetical protein
LDPPDQLKFKELLLRHRDVFSLNEDDIGRTTLVKHSIDTGNAPPIRQAPRRLPLAKQQTVREKIDEMRRQGIIEPASGPWASPIVLVSKKDGSTRFCVDYRRLNNITRKDSYPLPRIDTILDSLEGSCWFSTLDLKSGYWQVELDQKDKEKTAFCAEGLWQFRVMPFGLCNAPATFERLMDRVLSGTSSKSVLVYLDDVIIHGKTVEEELQHLDDVFQRLRQAGLKLSPNKCHFFKKETRYLGHIVGEDGIRTDPDKSKVVREWRQPRNQKEVRSFLGLCSYYRRFIQNFASIAKPLHVLSSVKKSFAWTSDCQAAFDTLKERLTSAPVLACPDPDALFILD